MPDQRVEKVKLVKGLLVSTALVTLGACGGGSAPNSGPVVQPTITPPPPPPPADPPPPAVDPAAFRTAEYSRNWALEAINAAEAYAEGVSGSGVTIGFLDFGFRPNTNELNLSDSSRFRDQQWVDIYEAQIGRSASTSPHGHAVAVTAAGRRNNNDTHGVAFNATVIAVDFFAGVNMDVSVQDGITVYRSNGYQYLMDQGARIVNKSIGFDEDDIIENPPVVDELYVLDQDINVVLAGGLLVVSAGNNSDPEPSLSVLRAFDRLSQFGLAEDGPGAMLIAGAVDDNLQIADFSDRAGNGPEQNYYLVAPGVDVTFPWTNGLGVGSGTSFSAPTVSGAAALVLERWPHLTAREAATILLDTATDLGAPGTDNVYGRGLLNIAAAVRPQGDAVITTASLMAAPVADTHIQVGAALGDAVDLRTALQSSLFLDGYGRDFRADFSGLVGEAPRRFGLQAALAVGQQIQSSGLQMGGIAFQAHAVSNRFDVPLFSLLGAAGEDFEPQPQLMFELTGRTGDMGWTIGQGRSLTDHMLAPTESAPTGALPTLTGAFRSEMGVMDSQYVSTQFALGDGLSLVSGVSVGERVRVLGQDLIGVQREADGTSIAAMMGIDYQSEHFALFAGLGALTERGGLLFSNGAGAFADTGDSQTLHMDLRGDWAFAPGWSVTGHMSLGRTNSGFTGGGLVADASALTTSSFTFRLAREGLATKSDRFALILHQPLRAEGGNATLRLADRLDAFGNAIFVDQQVGLTPSGREMAIEGAYRLELGSFYLEGAIAQRFDAGHIRGQSAQAALLKVGTSF